MILPVSFFARPTARVARELIGKVLWLADGKERVAGRIVEAEAYLGRDDPASHAGRGLTPRSAVMFGPAGHLYVYLIYGMYHCLNLVTEAEDRPGAVLIRALEPQRGLELMRRRRRGLRQRRLPECELCNGPGKICQAGGVDLGWNGLGLGTRSGRGRRVWCEDGAPPARIEATGRIGVSRARRRALRFVDPDSPCLSRRSPASRAEV